MTTDELIAELRASAVGPVNTDELVEWLREQYPFVRLLPDGSIACLAPLMFTTSVILGCNRYGYGNRFCFESRERALEVFEALQSEDDEPTGWVARR